MSFKIHLLVISVIIIMIYFITNIFMANKAAEVATIAPPVERSPYTITIERASWGENCNSIIDKNKSDDAVSTVRDNNVIYKVSRLCNGKPNCDISINSSSLGDDPMPGCLYKVLQVEYRCFSVDRLRKESASEGTININCDKQVSHP